MDLHLDVAAAPGRSLGARVEHALRDAVRSGRLAPGTRLPATRALAADLGISRGVVLDAYGQLVAEGLLTTARGGGTRVAMLHHPSAAPAPTWRGPRGPVAAAPRFDLDPALPATDGFPRTAWHAALGRTLRAVEDRRLGYGDPSGAPELRTAIARRLAGARGVRTQPGCVVVTGGVRRSLPLAWALLQEDGVRRVGIEAPGWPRIAQSLRAAGLQPVALEVDEEGVRTDELDRARVDAVAVTPAHQFPTGAVLSPARRGALVAWARERGGHLLEDDFDAEFRYDRAPVGSLQGLAPDVVVHMGSASKTFAPALRIGWLVLPPPLAERLAARPDDGDDPWPDPGASSPLDQLAYADLLARGDVDRHLRRQRRRYAARRAALLDALATTLPGLEVRGAAAGLFVVLGLPVGIDEAAVVDAARRAGLALEGVSQGHDRPPALAVGYANLPEASARPAAELLREVLNEVTPAPSR